jgi:hypothetical protein
MTCALYSVAAGARGAAWWYIRAATVSARCQPTASGCVTSAPTTRSRRPAPRQHPVCSAARRFRFPPDCPPALVCFSSNGHGGCEAIDFGVRDGAPLLRTAGWGAEGDGGRQAPRAPVLRYLDPRGPRRRHQGAPRVARTHARKNAFDS